MRVLQSTLAFLVPPLVIGTGPGCSGGAGGETAPEIRAVSSIHAFEVETIDGRHTSLATYQGKVLLVVNVASRCGFTPQYEELQELYERYEDRGLLIMGFPSNDFLGQEPGTNDEIARFCSEKYGVTFPMFSKINVKGKEIHPLYEWLTSQPTSPEPSGDISWNFNKFLVGRDGRLVHRFKTRTTPLDEAVVAAIESMISLESEPAATDVVD